MKCLVSGATGFIGRELCEKLASRDDTVIALSKSGAPLKNGQSTLAVDLAKNTPAAEVFRGVDVFFHLAGVAHQQAPASEYAALNYEATLRLARLASAAGVKSFVFLSSVKAMGSPDSSGARSEDSCTVPVDAYGLSKWQAECALRDEFSDEEMSVVILRPALVFGVNVKGNLQSLAAAVRRGLPRPPSGGRRSMIAVDDLVSLMCVIAQSSHHGVRTWIACGNESYSTQAIHDLLRQAGGASRGMAWMPRWGWRAAASLLDAWSGRERASTYEKLFGHEVYNNALVLQETNWQPRVRLEDVIDELVAADRANS